MSITPSARSSAERMWTLVPGWTRWRDEHAPGTGLLRGLIDALGVGLDAARDDVMRLLNDAFVETCDPKLIPLIGDLVGVSVDPTLPVSRQRFQVKYAIHLRRRKGTVEELETIVWQATGFRVTVEEPRSAQRTARDPPLSARVSGERRASIASSTVDVTGRVPAGRVKIVMDVAWPVRRSQLILTPVGHKTCPTHPSGAVVGPDLHAIDPPRAVGLRRADGTPILISDDPTLLVGPGLPIDIELIGADFDRLGPLTPRFMRLGGSAPFYVPHRTLAIDPERGRVAGPTAPTPGIQAYRRYRLQFWEPLSLEPLPRLPCADEAGLIVGESVVETPYALGEGIYAFASDGRVAPLTDAHGIRIKLVFEGENAVPVPAFDERLLVVLQPDSSHQQRRAPYVLLGPGSPLDPNLLESGNLSEPESSPLAQRLMLDQPGLCRLFSIEDDLGWDAFRTIRLVTEFGRETPADDTVEVDVERGHFRISPIYSDTKLRVRYFRRYDLLATKRRSQEVLLADLPLNCSATFLLRDTAPGRTEVHRP